MHVCVLGASEASAGKERVPPETATAATATTSWYTQLLVNTLSWAGGTS